MKKAIAIIILASVTLTGCSSKEASEPAAISQADYDKVVQERDKYKKKYETLLASASSSEDTSTNNNENTALGTDGQEQSTEDLSSGIKTKNEYVWNYANRYHYLGLELKNQTDYTLRLDAEFVFYDKDNNIIGTSKPNYVAFEPQSNILLYASNDEPFDHYEYFLNPSIDKYNKPVHSMLESDVSETDKKLIFSITNTGSATAKFVKCEVLFLLNGDVVNLNYAYAGTSSGEITPLQTERAEINKPYNTPYDNYILFMDGRASNND